MSLSSNVNKIKLSDVEFVVLDTETTGLNPDTDEVIELAMRQCQFGSSLKWLDKYESLYRPHQKIPPSSMATHHITNEMVSSSPFLENEIEKIKNFVLDRPVFAYNSDFDKGMMPSLSTKNWYDVQRLVMHVWHIGQLNQDGFPLTSFKQQELRYWLGLTHIEGDAHRADADIQVTGKIMQKAIDILFKKGLPDNYEIFMTFLNSPINHKTIPFGYSDVIGKKIQDLDYYEIKKMFNPKNRYFRAYEKFNVLDSLRKILEPEMLPSQSSVEISDTQLDKLKDKSSASKSSLKVKKQEKANDSTNLCSHSSSKKSSFSSRQIKNRFL